MSDKKGPLKANLKVSLYAGNVVVAESEDPVLWQEVLTAITQQASISPRKEKSVDEPGRQANDDSSDPIRKFASHIGVTTEQLTGACNPSLEAPYITLDMHYWEALKKKMPARGTTSVSNIAIAATLLCLWFKYAKISGQPTQKDCREVLDTIGVKETNPTRSLQNTSWLQSRNNGIVINPAETSKATDLAKLYCLKGKDEKAA